MVIRSMNCTGICQGLYRDIVAGQICPKLLTLEQLQEVQAVWVPVRCPSIPPVSLSYPPALHCFAGLSLH